MAVLTTAQRYRRELLVNRDLLSDASDKIVETEIPETIEKIQDTIMANYHLFRDQRRRKYQDEADKKANRWKKFWVLDI